jgi:tRNA modification GTPase
MIPGEFHSEVMNISPDDTIVALSTPPGEGGISIVRVSGKEALSLVEHLFVPVKPLAVGLKDRRVHYGHIVDGEKPLDEVLIFYLKSPHSYTRQDMVEIQCHGGMVPSARIVELLLARGGRMAARGEFTRRALLNGRIDVLQAEAVLSLIHAKTDQAMERAFEQLSGKVSEELREVRERLLDIISSLEALVDFPEEEIPGLPGEELALRLSALSVSVAGMIEGARRGSIYREGLRVAIVGKPNVGKSSLLNLLLGEERAIVTPCPGTTRDTVQEWCNIRGIPVMLIDTAGIRSTVDALEKEGVKRTLQCIEKSDMLLALFDVSEKVTDEDREILELLKRSGKPYLAVFNKIDRESPPASLEFSSLPVVKPSVRVSALMKTGFGDLLELFEKTVLESGIMVKESSAAATLRQKEKFLAIQRALAGAGSTLAEGFPQDLLLVDLRRALSLFGELTGECYDEALLDTLFSRFCIGK